MLAKEQTHGQLAEQLNGHVPPGNSADANDEESLAVLREILLDDYQERAVELRTQIVHLQTLLAKLEGQVEQLNDPVALADKITPSLAPAISTSIRDARESMIDALYPIIGKLITRAVTEALRDLARRIDEQMRSTLSVKSLTRRMQARVAGVSEAELALRDILPFEVLEIFLIYRESGLLIKALSVDPAINEDSDLISGMLTAIRDFADDAFGREAEGDLDEVQFGDRRILIETAKYTYAAVVIRGLEPSDFRAQIREQLAEIERRYVDALLHYDGNAAQLAEAEPQLAQLLQSNTTNKAPNNAPPSPAATDRSTPASTRSSWQLAPATRLLLWALLAVVILLLWRLWYTWQSNESPPDVIALFLELMRGTVIDYL